MALSWGAILAIILIIVGVILLIIGIIWYEVNNRNKVPQPWWVWALMIGGLVLAVVSGIALAFTLSATVPSAPMTAVYQTI